MNLVAPATIAPAVIDAINAELAATVGYLDDGLVVRRLMAECKKLMNVDPVNGHLAMAGVHQLTGNFDRVFYHANCVEKLQSNDPAVSGSVAAWFANLGFFSESYRRYGDAVSPSGGLFTRYFNMGLVIGAFQTMQNAIEQARKLKIDFSGLKVDVAESANRILASQGLSDVETVEILSIAGEVMRENRLFYLGECPDVDAVEIDGVESCVFVSYRVGATPDHAADMTAELSLRIAQRVKKIPTGFSVGFFGTAI